MDLFINDWPIIQLAVTKTNGSPMSADDVRELNKDLAKQAEERDYLVTDPWTVDSDGSLSIHEVISDPDETTVHLLMEAKKVIDDHGMDFSGSIYFVNANGSGVTKWVVSGDMVVDTVNVEDPAYPSYGDGDPVDVTFPDGTRVHAKATE